MADIHVVAEELRGFSRYLYRDVGAHDIGTEINEQATGRGCHPAGMIGLFIPLAGAMTALAQQMTTLCIVAHQRVDGVSYALEACADDYEHVDRGAAKKLDDAGANPRERSAS